MDLRSTSSMFETLIKVDFTSIFISVFVILSGFKGVVALLEWVSDKFGIEMRFIRKERERYELLISTVHNMSELQEQQKQMAINFTRCDNELKSELKDLTNMFIDERVDRLRYEILSFASSLSRGNDFSMEQFAHVFKLYDKYEKILEENGMTNGQVVDSMDVIREYYKTKLKSEL